MIKTVRKTTQSLAPGNYIANGAYNIYPARSMDGGRIELGFQALAERIAAHDHVVLDGMVGVMWEDFRKRLAGALAEMGLAYQWFDVSEAFLDELSINQWTRQFMGGDDPLFGSRNTCPLCKFFIREKLAAFGKKSAAANRAIVYGTGAALAAKTGFLVYVDVPKNEIQFRSRAGAITNLGARQPDAPKQMYKRFYFIDWPALRQHQSELLSRLDLIVDSQRPNQPAHMSGHDFRCGLSTAAHSWFRVRPWFEPGAWGGQWMKKQFPGMESKALNLAWSFELITPENGLTFSSSGNLLEAAFDWLMFQNYREVLGDFADRFGFEFPIRFDYLDTFEGGNLSLQCHPRPEYAARHFGERFTQDETYYIMDCLPSAQVFLGFQKGIDPKEFKDALARSFREAGELNVERFVQKHSAIKHGLYLIPNGTIHCSGKNNLVLEISATPYIFTFKMYDWMQLDLDRKPRPLNIERAMENLDFKRQGGRVQKDLISQPRLLERGEGWDLIHLPTHAEHFYDVHRFDFCSEVVARTEGSPHIFNVVEGPSIILETPNMPPQRFAFAETFVVPAATSFYRLRSDTGRPVKVVKAFLKPMAKYPTLFNHFSHEKS